MPNLVGTGLNQVPTNSMLGGLAYQDPEHASIKNLDLKNLSQINSEIADTAVDIFVYDTRKDSDGGAWRKRTQTTSWYNETLNTSTRGSRKEFPAVAVIVAKANNTVIIYDGDDPDLPMWMVMPVFWNWNTYTSLAALNGIVVMTNYGTNGRLMNAKFVADSYNLYDCRPGVTFNSYTSHISDRQTVANYDGTIISNIQLLTGWIRDVAMTVLPNAPIDSATGLPVPTIAFATYYGVNILKDDGTVVSTVSNNSGYTYARSVEWAPNGDLLFVMGDINGALDYLYTYDGFNSSNNSITIDTKTGTTKNARSLFRIEEIITAYASHNFDGFTVQGSVGAPNYSQFYPVAKKDQFECAVRSPQGLTHISENPDSKESLIAGVTSDYNTGWMHGDIKGAFLSDTTTGSISTNHVTNGNFSTGSGGWTGNSNTSLSVVSGVLRSESIASGSWSGANAMHQMGNDFVVGKTYSVTYDMRIGGTAGNYSSGIGSRIQKNNSFHSSNQQQAYYLYAATAPGTSFTTYSWTFEATTTTYGIEFFNWYGVVGNYFEIDNIVIKEAVADRSVNSNIGLANPNKKTTNGLTVYGSLTKTPVATGSDLVGYSGFSASNYLNYNPTPDINFGTVGTICYMGWMKQNGHGNYSYIISTHGSSNNNGAGMASFTGTGVFYVYNGTNAVQSAKVITDNMWHFCVGILDNGLVIGYVDGVQVIDSTYNYGPDMSDTTTFAVGHFRSGSTRYYPHLGSLALVRVSATIPSPEQIKKIYEDEKHLFQENAKATLYGSSDAVTAIAYDDTTNLLHVGTSAGRSEFQGLRRINNTTDAVTTAISASNGLVAEQ